MRVVFLGDIALNGQYIEYHKQGINPFATLGNELGTADFVIGNLESIAKGDQGENLLKKPRLTTTVETLGFLKDIRLDVACLAQNHVYDHLEDGFIKTTSFLKENNIKYLGAGHTAEEAAKPLILEKDNISIGILNYVTKDTNPKLPPDARITPNFFDENRVVKEIAELKPQVNHVILSLHWGGRVEGGLFPDFHQPRLARKLIDAGADLIIGHHSHTVQPYEIYKGKYIFYSLGNFCFSDYWFGDEFRKQPKRRRLTSILSIPFSNANYKHQISFYRNKNTHYTKLQSYRIKINNFLFTFFLNKKLFWNIYYVHLKWLLPFFYFVRRNDVSISDKVNRISASLTRRLTKKHTYNK